MRQVTHYEVLGVRPGATAAEIRKAYVARARRAHPDVAGAAGDDTMRVLNSAWTVLGDPEARRRYDLTLPDVAPQAPQSNVHRPVERPFVPYHAVDEDDDDEWRYVDDETDPDTAPGTAMQLAPMVLLAVGVALLIVGGIVKVTVLVGFGAALIALGAVGFLIVPLMVMARASTVEQRRDREREARRRRS